MVEVFKTNVKRTSHAKSILEALSKTYPAFDINFDLDDCDKILRVKGKQIQPQKIISLVAKHGFRCAVLEE